MANIKMHTKIGRDAHNAIIKANFFWFNGKEYRVNPHSFVWRNRVWKDGANLYSRMEGVISVDGIEYRVCDKVIKPLVLTHGETVYAKDHPIYNKSFVV